MEYDALRRGVAEFVCAFALIFVGVGSIMSIQSNLALFAGAVLAALALRALFPSEANLDQGVPVVNETISAGAGSRSKRCSRSSSSGSSSRRPSTPAVRSSPSLDEPRPGDTALT